MRTPCLFAPLFIGLEGYRILNVNGAIYLTHHSITNNLPLDALQYRVTQKKWTHLPPQSPVTRSKIKIVERFKKQKNSADLLVFEAFNNIIF